MAVSARLAVVRAALRTVPWAELAAALALIGGWTLLTWALASFTRTWQVWPASGGLFLMSLFGWRYFGVMARDGLYTLTRERR